MIRMGEEKGGTWGLYLREKGVHSGKKKSERGKKLGPEKKKGRKGKGREAQSRRSPLGKLCRPGFLSNAKKGGVRK